MISFPAPDVVVDGDVGGAGDTGDTADTGMTAAGPDLGADLLSVVARLNRFATQQVPLSLPGAQARLLSTIEAMGEARISELAAVDHCSQPTMTTQVRRLEDAGLTARTPDPHDARAVLIRITEKGLRTLARVRHDRAAALDPQLARLAPEDRRTLADAVLVLRRFLAFDGLEAFGPPLPPARTGPREQPS